MQRVQETRTYISLFITLFELHTPAAAGPVLSCCCQPPHLVFVPVLPSPVSELPSPVTHTPTQVCRMSQSLFCSRRLRLGFLQGFPASQRGQEKKIAWDFLVTWEKEEEVPGPSPAGRSPLHPGFQGRATHGAPVQWLLHVPLSPAACRWTGRKRIKTLNSLLPLQSLIFLDGTAHF